MTLAEFQAEVNRICAELVTLPPRKRLKRLQNEVAKFPGGYRETALQLIATSVDITETTMKTWEKITMIAAGAVIIFVILCVVVFIPYPSDFQIFVFRIILAIGVAAFGCAIPGFLDIKSKSKLHAIRAGGALALFVIIFLVNPPQLIREKKNNTPPSSPQTNSTTPVSVQTNK
jgi:hypothetical protein